MTVAVVTDSTSYLPARAAADLGIRVVPLHVRVGSQTHRDGVTLGAAELAEAMGRKIPVSTSRAGPAELAAAYRAALDEGATAVVAVHLSRKLSGTWEAARLAAEELGGPRIVRVVDSRSAAMGLGYAALAAAVAARDGASAADVEEVAAAIAARTRTFFSVDTLEHLRRGGRIGRSAALLGTALAVKPLLHVVDGRIEPLEKVRTAAKAVARLADLAVEAAGTAPCRVAVHHLAAPNRADQLVTRIREVVPRARDIVLAELGAVLGAHTGPGALGVVILPDA
ncbi:MAG TPA: DegV family protein [Pseudonocardiaceae bacterium]